MLSKKYRLTKHGSFSYLYAHGSRASEKPVRLNFVKSKAGVKIGFSVSNKIGHAVVRNKVKPRMRAVAAEYIHRLSPCQAGFIVSQGVDKLSFKDLKSKMDLCLVRSGLLRKTDDEKEKKD